MMLSKLKWRKWESEYPDGIMEYAIIKKDWRRRLWVYRFARRAPEFRLQESFRRFPYCMVIADSGNVDVLVAQCLVHEFAQRQPEPWYIGLWGWLRDEPPL